MKNEIEARHNYPGNRGGTSQASMRHMNPTMRSSASLLDGAETQLFAGMAKSSAPSFFQPQNEPGRDVPGRFGGGSLPSMNDSSSEEGWDKVEDKKGKKHAARSHISSESSEG